MHLTNYSVNKNNMEEYIVNNDANSNYGNKWYV